MEQKEKVYELEFQIDTLRALIDDKRNDRQVQVQNRQQKEQQLKAAQDKEIALTEEKSRINDTINAQLRDFAAARSQHATTSNEMGNIESKLLKIASEIAKFIQSQQHAKTTASRLSAELQNVEQEVENEKTQIAQLEQRQNTCEREVEQLSSQLGRLTVFLIM